MPRLITAFTLALVIAGSMFAADVTGQWSGTVLAKTPDGDHPDAVFMSLKQTGSVITGTAGPSADRQSEIKEGKIDGSQIQFKVAVGDATAFIHLKLDGDTLKGQADVDTPDGKVSAALDLKRAQ